MLRDVLFTLGTMRIRVGDKLKAETGDWKSFRQKNRNRIRFTEDGGTSMDTVWLELQDTYGKGMFPDVVMNHGDQLMYLDDLLDSLSHDFQNPYQGVWGQTIEQMSIDIIDQLMSSEVRQAGKTRADRIADRARAQAEEAIRDMVEEDFAVYINDRAEAIAGKEIARLRNRQEKQLRNQRNKLEKLEDNCKQIPQSAKTRSIRAKRRNNGKYEKRLSAKCRKPNCKTGNLQRETEESRIYISSRLLH